jgi:aspartate kinase
MRPLVVQKFGGTSVGTIERMHKVADIVGDEFRAGNNVIVVVSAMSGETDRLIRLAHSAVAEPNPRELDCLVATGEQVSVALLAMILDARGIPARSILGFQMGMLTDAAHTKARIVELDEERFSLALAGEAVLVAAGFQGVGPEGQVTTLGRGGSDTTAVAIAAGLNADYCDIYTDVDGVYTADPNMVSNARRLDRISYEEMLELASTGAKVLQIRSVEMGMKYGVRLRVRSTFTRGPGTLVTKEDESMEAIVVAGVACDRNEAKIALRAVPDQPGIAARIFTPLSEANIVVDMIIQNMSLDGTTDLTFTVPRTDLKQAVRLMESLKGEVGIQRVESDSSIAKVSIVGVGMRSHAGVASRMFVALAKEGVNIQMISTSEIKISAVIDEKYAELAVRALHEAFELHQAP